MEKKKLLKEALIVWISVIVVSSVLFQIYLAGLISSDLLFLLSASLLLYVPIVIYIKRKEKVAFIDQGITDFFRSLKLFFIVSILVFSVALFVNHFVYQALMMGQSYHPQKVNVSWWMIVGNRFIMALPEEFFFRGYFQDRLNQVWGRPWKIFGAPVGKGLIVTCILFALSHSLIHVQWWHFLIFFPSLVFGWLKEKSGTITSPILFHALCNIFSDWVWYHY